MVVIFSLLISLIIFLFTFYYYAREDLFFIRKGISMEQLFNVLLIGLSFGVFFSRLLYVFLYLKFQLINPVKFILVSHFPGVSLFGGVVALFIACSFLAKRRKILRQRFLDYVSLALLSTFPVFFLGVFSNIYLFVMYTIVFIFFIIILLPKYYKGSLREGTISYMFLAMASVILFLQDVFLLYSQNIILSKESFLFIGLFFVAVFLLLRLETIKPRKLNN